MEELSIPENPRSTLQRDKEEGFTRVLLQLMLDFHGIAELASLAYRVHIKSLW